MRLGLGLGLGVTQSRAGGAAAPSWATGFTLYERWVPEDAEARFSDAAGITPADIGDDVRNIAATYNAGRALTLGDDQDACIVCEQEGKAFLVPAYEYGVRAAKAWTVPAAFVGKVCNVGVRSPLGLDVGPVLVGADFAPLLAQEILLGYPYDASRNADMEAFLTAHNTITYHDAIAYQPASKAGLSTFYGGSYGYGAYGVITDGIGTLTFTTAAGDYTAPPMSDGNYHYSNVLSVGDFVDVSVAHGDELTDIEWFGVKQHGTALIGRVTAPTALVLSDVNGFPPEASTWPATAECVQINGGFPTSTLIGRYEDWFDMAVAGNKATCKRFHHSFARMTGVLDLRPLIALQHAYLTYLDGVEEINGNGITTLLTAPISNISDKLKRVDFGNAVNLGGAFNYANLPAITKLNYNNTKITTFQRNNVGGATFDASVSNLPNATTVNQVNMASTQPVVIDNCPLMANCGFDSSHFPSVTVTNCEITACNYTFTNSPVQSINLPGQNILDNNCAGCTLLKNVNLNGAICPDYALNDYLGEIVANATTGGYLDLRVAAGVTPNATGLAYIATILGSGRGFAIDYNH